MAVVVWETRFLNIILTYAVIILVFWGLHFLLFQAKPANYHGASSGFDIFYFTFTTQSTVGFGDIYPVSRKAKVLTMIQIITTLLLTIGVMICFSC